MKKIEFNPIDRVGDIVKAVQKGAALITTQNSVKVNCMTIAWGQIGVEWNKLIFTTYVRTGRFTHKMLKESGEFTVNLAPQEPVSKITGFCGAHSGTKIDKVKELGLTTVAGLKIATPGLKELPLTLECKVIYRQDQVLEAVADDLREKFYPQEVPSENCGSNRDRHTMFYGEIVGAYCIE